MIKYVAGMLLGIVLGVLAAVALLYFNPLAARNPLSPLSVSNNSILSLGYSGVVGGSDTVDRSPGHRCYGQPQQACRDRHQIFI